MDPLEAFEDELRKQQAYQVELAHAHQESYLDWFALFNHEGHDTDWLVEDIWPMGRQIHMHAQRKSGKSLVSLHIACNLAIGRDPFTREPIPPRRMGYWDFEMTEDDVRERVTDMGFAPDQLGNLHYYLMQPIGMLDTREGGQRLLDTTLKNGDEAVIIDTMSRVVEGDENSSDTYINFYRFTGGPLKANGVSLARLDHEGHEGGRSRGSSAKADDVDIVWQLKPTDDGVQFIRKAARISWVPEQVTIRKSDEPLTYSRAANAWPDGTKEKAKELDAIDAPIEITRRMAAQSLKAGGYLPGKTTVLNAAIKYRKQRMVFP